MLRKITLFVSRRKRKQTLCYLFVACIAIYFIFKCATSLYLSFVCWRLKQFAVSEICQSFTRHKNVGILCYDLCVTKQQILLDCPNFDGHNGKDYVFTAVWRSKKVVVKARKLTTETLVSGHKEPQFDDNLLRQSIKDVFAVAFNYSEIVEVESLVPWKLSANENLQDLNSSSVRNVWYLCQDNEYMLSKIFGDFPRAVFPKVVATCGHFYATEFVPRILDISFVITRSLGSQTFSNRLDVSIMLFDFLESIEKSRVHLELCDVKYEHFGILDDSGMVMIDSDMIYHGKIVGEVIEAIGSCKTDRDCDFIDCQGKCVASKCTVDKSDNNLKRICRNMLFMGSIESDTQTDAFGLLTNYPFKYNEKVDLIKQLCFQDSQENYVSKVNVILKLLKNMQS